MRAVLQRVARASVRVEEQLISEIGEGLLIYLGVAPTDSPERARHLASRLAQLRIFPDPEERMNRSLLDSHGAALVVSQFTLFADCSRGHRPSFISAAAPAPGRELYLLFAEELRQLGVSPVLEGRFGAAMAVESLNSGPVTIVASSGEGSWPTDCG